MSDERLSLLWSERGHGRLTAELALKREGGRAWLAGSDAAVGLVLDGDAPRIIDLREAPFRFRERVLGAELELEGETLQIPSGKVAEAKRLIALARAAGVMTPPRSTLPAGRYVEERTALEARVLGEVLEEDEVLLVWLKTATLAEVPSPLAGERAPLSLLVTDRRQALLAVGALGDFLVKLLPASPVDVDKTVGRDLFRAGGLEWQAPLFSEAVHKEVLALPALSPEQRTLEVARLSLARGAKEGAVVARELLARLVALGDPYGVLTAASLRSRLDLKDPPDEDAVNAALAALVERERGSAGLLKWWRGFGLSLEDGLALLARLFDGATEREWSVELHAGLRDVQLQATDDIIEQAAVDIAYGEHLVATRRYEEAQLVMEARLAALPDEELLDLLPAEDADLTEGAGGQRLRVRVLELLALARGEGETRDAATVRQLAQLQPLAPDRVKHLYDLASGEVKAAAEEVISVLAPGGLAPLDERAPLSPDDEVFPLKKKALYERLRHPAAREGHALDKLQSFLASIDVPDHAALRSYCERLGTEHEAAWAALADASVALSLKGVGAFVSRGDKAVGIRAYDGAPPFLIIGGRHLEQGSDFFLHPWELRFAIASELAHLRFQHTRVTTRDVWTGAIEKGRLGVDLVLGMIPVLKGVDVIDRVGRIIDHYKKGPLGRVMKGLDLAERTVTKVRGKAPKKPGPRPKEQMVAATNDKLIAAHRVMQLTADRAGLLIARDLGASLRAIFKSTHDSLAELPVAQRHGVAKALSRRDEDGEILHQDLAVRVSSLVSFFLSDDYRELRARLTTPPRAREPSQEAKT